MLAKAMSENMYFHSTFRMARQVNAALTSAVYRKSLRLAPASRQNFTVGEIVNLMQLDSNRLGNEFIPQMHSLWDGLYQIVGYSAQAIYYLGPSALVGIAVMIIAIPAQFYFMMKLMRERQGMVKDTDKRIKQMNEILQGIKVVKLYNWENSFISSIENSRANEMNRLKHVSALKAANGAIMMATPAMVATCAFLTYSASGAPFLASTLFTVIMIYGQLRFPLMMYPQMGAALQNARLSANRIERFLNAPEIDENAKNESCHIDDSNVVVSIQKGTFHWTTPEDAKKYNDEKLVAAKEKLDKLNSQIQASKTPKKKVVVVDARDADIAAQREKEAAKIQESVSKMSKWETPKPTLENVDLEVKKGQLVAIIGSVGSGKSSLLSAILGDMFKVDGKVFVNGKVAYVSQTAWIVNASAKENIVFGNTLSEEKYDKVVNCCQLLSDFEILPNGDSTEIGEKGINLSGGQKQRVSIARAVYDDADVYIFDDPLSALDTEVGGKIFSECISEALKDKTRILVTNQLQYLSSCDKILVIKDGVISESGTYTNNMVYCSPPLMNCIIHRYLRGLNE
jgi:ABC-type multidrug transport system fused ATPase/permease subunit